jgi:hypothetical protein
MAKGKKTKKRVPQLRYDGQYFTWIALPLDMLRYILQYLNWREIGFFDNSLLNHGVRAHYLKATEKMPISFPTLQYNKWRDNQLTWLIQRGFSLKELTTCLEPLGRALLSNSRETLIDLTLVQTNIDAEIEKLTENLPNLICLRLSGSGVTNRGLRDFLAKSPKLKSLSLGTDLLSPDAIQILESCCPNLTKLDVSWSAWFGNEALRQLSKSNLKLKSLNITGSKVTDSLSPLIEKMPSLRRLQQSNFSRLDDWRCALQCVALPGILSDDPETQLMGLSHFSEFLEFQYDLQRVDIVCSMSSALHRIIELLALETTEVRDFLLNNSPLSHTSC